MGSGKIRIRFQRALEAVMGLFQLAFAHIADAQLGVNFRQSAGRLGLAAGRLNGCRLTRGKQSQDQDPCQRIAMSLQRGSRDFPAI
jgi:hypothetical protein